MSFIQTDKRHPIMWRKNDTSNQIKWHICPTEQNISIAVTKETSVDKWLFVQFITAVRQIKASSRVAEDNISNGESYAIERCYMERKLTKISAENIVLKTETLYCRCKKNTVEPFSSECGVVIMYCCVHCRMKLGVAIFCLLLSMAFISLCSARK